MTFPAGVTRAARRVSGSSERMSNKRTASTAHRTCVPSESGAGRPATQRRSSVSGQARDQAQRARATGLPREARPGRVTATEIRRYRTYRNGLAFTSCTTSSSKSPPRCSVGHRPQSLRLDPSLTRMYCGGIPTTAYDRAGSEDSVVPRRHFRDVSRDQRWRRLRDSYRVIAPSGRKVRDETTRLHCAGFRRSLCFLFRAECLVCRLRGGQ